MIYVSLIWILCLDLVLCKINSVQQQPERKDLVVSYGSKLQFSGKDNRFELSLFTKQLCPTITFENAKEETNYTLLMLDPDAPSHDNSTAADWLHWGYINVRGKDLKAGFERKRSSGHQLIDYYPPNPPQGSGPHCYQFILLEQAHKIEENNSSLKITNRARFDRRLFFGSHRLTPVAEAEFITEKI